MVYIPLDLNKIAVKNKSGKGYHYGEMNKQMIDAILQAIDNDQKLVQTTNDHQPGYVNVNGMDIFYNPAFSSSDFRDKDGNYDLDGIWRNIEYLPYSRLMNNDDVERLAGRLNEWNTLKLLPGLGSQKLREHGLGLYRNPNAVGVDKSKTILSVIGDSDHKVGLKQILALDNMEIIKLQLMVKNYPKKQKQGIGKMMVIYSILIMILEH